MSKTITVKGESKVFAKADTVVFEIIIETTNMDYNKAMEEYEQKLASLNKSLESIGFEKDSIKTKRYKFEADYKTHWDKGEKYQKEFLGYKCRHNMTLKIDFDNKRLSEVITAVTNSNSNAEISVEFVANEIDEINDRLLQEIAVNARKKAELLCKSSGVSLGKLVGIEHHADYYKMRSRSDLYYSVQSIAKSVTIDIEPEDIEISDSAVFVWEIE